MLNFTLTPHREYFPANTPLQKLFLMLKIQPNRDLVSAVPDTTVIVVVDTSGSMRDLIHNPHGPSQQKLEIVIQALQGLLSSNLLGVNDRIALVQFDDQSTLLLSPTSTADRERIESAIDSLRAYSGGTYMAKGLRQALDTLKRDPLSTKGNCRVLVLTDGETFDEEDCKNLINQFSSANLPITALGVGDEFNEDLLNALSDAAGGRSFHIVTGNAQGTQVNLHQLPDTIQEEFSLTKAEVVTNIKLAVKTVQGVRVNRLMRAYPSYTEFISQTQPYNLGNASVQEPPVFILELEIHDRPESRVRLAQGGITYTIPGKNETGELPPKDVVVEFIAGEGLAVQVDPEVMHYVQQCNLDKIVKEAAQIAETNPERAEQLLANARRMTQRVGNNLMDTSLASAQEELRKTRRISETTRKTIKMGSKGKTIKMEGEVDDISDDLIQKLTGA